jgi:nitroreductase
MSDPTELLRARYGTQPLPPLPTFNPVLETLLSHRSVRSFLPDALAEGTLETLITAAQSAPTSSNLQAWSVIAVEDPERKARLADLAGAQAHIREAPLFLVWLADLSRLGRLAKRAGRQAEGLRYLDTFIVSITDAALAAQNVVTAAESLGLGTVYIGALRNRLDEVVGELGVPQQVFPVFGLVVGKPDPLRPATVKPRLPQRAILHRERYAAVPSDDEVADYDRVLEGFYASQGQQSVRWSSQAVQRVHAAETLNGRQHLRAKLAQLGFELA